MKKQPIKKKTGTPKKEELPGYPVYPPNEDIYSNEKEVPFDEELLPGYKKPGINPELDYGLDVPGSELDDESETIGTEDEENNYYSIGGDNHSNLDENNAE